MASSPEFPGLGGKEEEIKGHLIEYYKDILAAVSKDSRFESETTKSIDLKFITKLDDYDFTTSTFFDKVCPGHWMRHYWSANEFLAALISLVCNSLIILTFCRVIGLARLPSRLFVSMACCKMVIAIQLRFHTELVISEKMGLNPNMCTLHYILHRETNALLANVYTSLIIERFIMITVPTYYQKAVHIFGPVLIFTPWLLSTFSILSTWIVYSNVDFGYNCNSHLNPRSPQPELESYVTGALYINRFFVAVLLIALGMMWNVSSGDYLEIQREKFEKRTTILLIKIIIVSFLFAVPLQVALAIIKLGNVDVYGLIHNAYQFTVHNGVSLMLVLLTRKEFRKYILLVFSSRSVIQRAKMTNILMHTDHHQSRTSKSPRSSFFDIGKVAVAQAEVYTKKKKSFVYEDPRKLGFPVTDKPPAKFVSRDKDFEMPDWLQE